MVIQPDFVQEFISSAIVAHFDKKILIIMNKATQHRAGIIKEYLKRHKQIKVLYFPTDTPEINVVEQCWAWGKQKLLATRMYETLEEFKHFISECFRTTTFRSDVIVQLYKETLPKQ